MRAYTALPPGDAARLAALHAPVLLHDEPPPGSAVDLAYVVCTARAGGFACRADPTHNEQTQHDSTARMRQCFALTARAATADEIAGVEAVASGRHYAPRAGRAPTYLLVEYDASHRGPEYEGYGCEGAHDHPCDRVTRPTGRTIDIPDVRLATIGPSGAEVPAQVYPTWVPTLPGVQFDLRTVSGGHRADPALEVPREASHDLDAYNRAYLARLEAMDPAAEGRDDGFDLEYARAVDSRRRSDARRRSVRRGPYRRARGRASSGDAFTVIPRAVFAPAVHVG